jgi:predicted SprT family Zn-dependent metalloprotease
LAETFLKELDTTITNGQIAALAASTGGIKVIWSNKLNTTAGRANWKRETLKSSSSAIPTYRHHAAIDLASKVIDNEDRLLNVVAHEFCHLANFMISNIKTNPHGTEFKVWARKVSTAFKERGVEVTTKHTYEIEFKYIWECEGCKLVYQRHSKSIDPVKHRCGKCKGVLEQVKPVPRISKVEGNGKARANPYQSFVKENLGKIREENPGSPLKVVMGIVGERYRESKNVEEEEGKKKVGGGGGASDGNGVTDRGLEGVVRKLDFLDLTSP